MGEEPDVRFSLANERTALAWIRTSFATIAGGLAVVTVTALTNAPAYFDLLALALCLVGACLAVSALYTWRRNERALRLNQPLPAPTMLAWVVGGVVLLSISLVLVLVLTMAWA